jgi:hypothetical protein
LKPDVHVRKISVPTTHRKIHTLPVAKMVRKRATVYSEKQMTFMNGTRSEMLKTFMKNWLMLEAQVGFREKEARLSTPETFENDKTLLVP